MKSMFLKLGQWIRRTLTARSLKTNLIRFMLVQAAIISLIVSVFSYYNASISMRKRSIGFSTELAGVKTAQIEAYIDRVHQYAQDILYEQSLYDIMHQTIDFDEEDIFAERNKNEILEEYGGPVMNLFSKIILSRVEIQSLALYDMNGDVWISDHDNSRDFDIDNYLMDPRLFRSIMAAENDTDASSFIPVRLYGYMDQILYVRQVFSPDTYQQLGYFIVVLDPVYFTSLIDATQDEQLYDLVILDNHQQPITQLSDPMRESVQRFLQQEIVWQIDPDNEMLLTRNQIQGTRWILVTSQDLSVLFNDTLVLRNTLILIALVVMGIFAFLSIAISRDILRPVQRLTDSMKRVQQGESGVNVTVDRNDELGYMSKTFNDMIHRNETLVRGIYRAEITRKDAELQALQSQINPHFLYNTLETISWTARLQGVDEISEMVEDLSDIMEAGIGRNKSLITLREEIEYIDKYLRLMKKRYEERLQVEKAIDTSLLSYRIPKLLIQPLIENAIYHGIDRASAGGMIRIAAKQESDVVRIHIINSGKVIQPEEMEYINDHLAVPSDEYFNNLKEHQKANVGLQNVNRRIKLYCGEEYGIQISIDDSGYTIVTATLPVGGMDEI